MRFHRTNSVCYACQLKLIPTNNTLKVLNLEEALIGKMGGLLYGGKYTPRMKSIQFLEVLRSELLMLNLFVNEKHSLSKVEGTTYLVNGIAV